ncbi:MAG: sugar phosphate isomerase/epimerase family protein [Deinococcales bacterium]
MRLGFTPLNAMILDTNEAFKLAEELKLDFVELSFDAHEILPSAQEVRLVRELTRATGIGVTLHLSYVDLNLASLFPGVRENSVARTQRGLEYAAEVGAICAVLHSGLVPLRHELLVAAAKQKLEQSLQEITPLVPIALENLALDSYDLLRGASELEAVTQRIGWGNCIDVGHALVEGCTTDAKEGRATGGLEQGRKRLQEYIGGLSNTIHLHLQDNDGTSDQHRVLGSVDGGVPWAELREWLCGFAGTINLEINGSADTVRQSVRFLRDLLA